MTEALRPSISTITSLRRFGFALIPLLANSKLPAIAWQPYQQRQPSAVELNHWFSPHNNHNIGVVTGGISQLVVLDIDDSARLAVLQNEHPDLVATLTVRTRRGYHLYYRIPAEMQVASRRGAGLDLKGEGGYVVAPGSVVDGHSYEVDVMAPPRQLDADELEQLRQFVRSATVKQPRATRRGTLSREALVALYRAAAGRDGRNNALFRLSCLARDHGWSEPAVVEALAGIHRDQPTAYPHQPETLPQRLHEGLRTIASAFSGITSPARSCTPAGLPNTVREALFRLKQTNAVRTIEGLRLQGIRPGDTVTRQTACLLLRGVVGRDSIHAGLTATTNNGEPLFERQSKTKTCCLVGVKNPVKRYHRPAEVFVMPDNHELADRLGVPVSNISDPLDLDDLRQAHLTRQRCHTLFLQRRPGQYPVSLFARRLGVTERTIHSYHAQDPAIRAEIRLETTPISWKNVDKVIPEELPHRGFWLEDETRKRYPAKVGIARSLLRQGRGVVLQRRLPNYWYVEAERRQSHDDGGRFTLGSSFCRTGTSHNRTVRSHEVEARDVPSEL